MITLDQILKALLPMALVIYVYASTKSVLWVTQAIKTRFKWDGWKAFLTSVVLSCVFSFLAKYLVNQSTLLCQITFFQHIVIAIGIIIASNTNYLYDKW